MRGRGRNMLKIFCFWSCFFYFFSWNINVISSLTNLFPVFSFKYPKTHLQTLLKLLSPLTEPLGAVQTQDIFHNTAQVMVQMFLLQESLWTNMAHVMSFVKCGLVKIWLHLVVNSTWLITEMSKKQINENPCRVWQRRGILFNFQSHIC